MIDMDATAAEFYRRALAGLREVPDGSWPDTFAELNNRDADLVRGMVCEFLRDHGIVLTSHGNELVDRWLAWTNGELWTARTGLD